MLSYIPSHKEGYFPVCDVLCRAASAAVIGPFPAIGMLSTLQLWNLRSVFLSVPSSISMVHGSSLKPQKCFSLVLWTGVASIWWYSPWSSLQGTLHLSLLLLCQKPPFSDHSGARYKVFPCFSVPLGSGCQFPIL